MLHNTLDFTSRTPAAPADCPFGGMLRRDVLHAHNSMVRRIAWHVYARMSSSVELEDLVQIGLIALIECADSYEDRGFAFATYASTRVRGAMIDQLRRSARMPRSAMSNRRRLSATRCTLEQRLMREPDAAEMAAEMKLDAGDYHRLLNATVPIESGSVDDMYSDQQSCFADPAVGADGCMESAEMGALLAECITKLPARDAKILHHFFVEDWSLEQIGQTLGVGAARVCQIKKAALQKLRTRMLVDA